MCAGFNWISIPPKISRIVLMSLCNLSCLRTLDGLSLTPYNTMMDFRSGEA